MSMNLTEKQLRDIDIQIEVAPEAVMEMLQNLNSSDFAPQSQNRIKYFMAKTYASLGQYSTAMDLALECINQAIPEKDYFILVKCNILQDFCFFRTNQPSENRPYLEIALEYATQAENLTLSIYARTHYLMFLRSFNHNATAVEEARKILDLLKRVPVSHETTNALMQVAAVYREVSKKDLAVKYLKQAIEHARQINHPVLQLTLLNNLGSAYLAMNSFQEAEEILLNGLKLSQQTNLVRQVILFYISLGNLKMHHRKYREALEYFEQCHELISSFESKPPMLLMDLYNNLSMCHWFLREKENSLAYIDKSICIAKDNGFTKEEIQISVNKTNLLIDIGKFAEAGEILHRAAKFYQKLKDNHQLIWVHRTLANFYSVQREYRKAYEVNRKLDSITDNYISEILQKQTESLKSNAAIAEMQNNIHISSVSAPDMTDGTLAFIGRSKAWQNVLNSALLAAQHQNTSVMIIGESGTGKEIIAQIIHKNSLRRHYAFVPVNVGAVSSSLIESELFGHTKGAFTGAHQPTKGLFLQADKGTLFLDEITEMPYEQQSKLLRAVESRKVTQVGSSKEIPYDSRIISATNQNIRKALTSNVFRLDLYHRLNTIEIYIPPLRERPEDIEPIFMHYLDFYSKELNKPRPRIDSSLMQMISQYSFPGNARELKNMVERLYILSSQQLWDAALLCQANPLNFDSSSVKDEAQDPDEVSLIINALIKAKGKQKVAAKLLEMSEATLYRRIVKHNLQTYTRKGS